MKIEVLKIAETPNSTASQMRVDGSFFCFILEDGYRANKEHGKTRIPDGTYIVEPQREGHLFERYSKQNKIPFIPHIKNVPNFSGILIHPGNTIEDTEGCPLTGLGIELLPTGVYSIPKGRSTLAFLRLIDKLIKPFKEGTVVTITFARDDQPVTQPAAV